MEHRAPINHSSPTPQWITLFGRGCGLCTSWTFPVLHCEFFNYTPTVVTKLDSTNPVHQPTTQRSSRACSNPNTMRSAYTCNTRNVLPREIQDTPRAICQRSQQSVRRLEHRHRPYLLRQRTTYVIISNSMLSATADDYLGDPWLEATVSAKSSPYRASASRPVELSDGFHCSDLVTSNGRVDTTVAAVQRQGLAAISRWLSEFRPAATKGHGTKVGLE